MQNRLPNHQKALPQPPTIPDQINANQELPQFIQSPDDTADFLEEMGKETMTPKEREERIKTRTIQVNQ